LKRAAHQAEESAPGAPAEDLQKLIGEEAIEIRFLTAVEELKPSWAQLEATRVAERLSVKAAMELLVLSRTSYYRRVREMTTGPILE